MNVSLEEASRWAAAEIPHPVSGRCSVFCKSDCTHATNKGVPKAKVTAGLCRMMANKILELLKKLPRRDILLTGGTARNRMMVDYLRREIPGLIVPEEAPYFEALGAALWALRNETRPYRGPQALFHEGLHSFDSLPPLQESASRVEFKPMAGGRLVPGDICLLGLDVGSTTTKAVLVRKSDDALLASVYLRTNGDPVGASRQCYRAVLEQVEAQADPRSISIEGLGVCGSGRQIAGLHALTEGVVNEIIAHAAAAVFFDPGVDTLFEIGGQDAKYTYITNGVPSDYAMNEACSAGTGSFLEESALETLGVRMEEIEQSLRLIEQGLAKLPAGPIMAANVPRVLKPPAGDYTYAVEAARGRFAVRIVSDGKEKPYRVKLRTPSFSNLSLFEETSAGLMLPDAIALMGSLDLVIPDIDR